VQMCNGYGVKIGVSGNGVGSGMATSYQSNEIWIVYYEENH